MSGDSTGRGVDRAARRRLLETMAASCAERGYAATEVEDLLARSGVSRRVFEAEFGSLEDCALAAVEEILGAGLSAVSHAYSDDASERESAIAALRALLRLFARRPDFARLAFIDSRQVLPGAARERYGAGFLVLAALLDRLRTDPQTIEVAPPAAARAAIGGGEALVRRELASGRPEKLPALLPDLVYAAAVPFLGQHGALELARRTRAPAGD